MSGEDLLVELEQKENDLLLVAKLKNLLEERDRLEQDLSALRTDFACLEEVLELQKQESFKCTKLAEVHISELEMELDDCKSCLKQEIMAASSAREDSRRSCRQLDEENAQLKECLAEVMEKHEIEVKELKSRFIESREQNEMVSVDYAHAHHSLEELQGKNQSLGRNLSSVSLSCERLSLELEDSRDTAGYWENQYHSQEELLHSQAKELDDSRNQLKLLQMQLDQKAVMASCESVSSGLCLYEELSQLEEVGQQDESTSVSTSVISYSSDNDSCIMEDEKVLSLRPACTVAELSSSSEVMQGQRGGNTQAKPQDLEGVTGLQGECQRCQAVEVEKTRLETELSSLNKQLLLAVQQKFNLQQQVEDWQCDMTVMVDSRLQRELAKDCGKLRRRQDVSAGYHEDGGAGNKTNCRSRLSFHILKMF